MSTNNMKLNGSRERFANVTWEESVWGRVGSGQVGALPKIEFFPYEVPKAHRETCRKFLDALYSTRVITEKEHEVAMQRVDGVPKISASEIDIYLAGKTVDAISNALDKVDLNHYMEFVSTRPVLRKAMMISAAKRGDVDLWKKISEVTATEPVEKPDVFVGNDPSIDIDSLSGTITLIGPTHTQVPCKQAVTTTLPPRSDSDTEKNGFVILERKCNPEESSHILNSSGNSCQCGYVGRQFGLE